jgi:hypothetical protein
MQTAKIKYISHLVEFEVTCKHCKKTIESDIDFFGLKLNHYFNCCNKRQYFQIKMNKEHVLKKLKSFLTLHENDQIRDDIFYIRYQLRNDYITPEKALEKLSFLISN